MSVTYSKRTPGRRVATNRAGDLVSGLDLGDYITFATQRCVRFGGPWGSFRGVIVEPLISRTDDGEIAFEGELTTGGRIKRTVPPQCPVHVHEYR